MNYQCRRCDRGLSENDKNPFSLCKFCQFDATYSHLLRTNAVPSAYERRVVQKQLELQRNSLSSIDCEITSQMDDSDTYALQTERNFILKRLQLYESAASPVRSLPDDLWGTIFTRVIEGNKDKCIRLTLSHVCLKWRDLVLNNPMFWNNITLDDRNNPLAEELFIKVGNTSPIDLVACYTPYGASKITFDWMEKYIGRLQKLELRNTIPMFPWLETFDLLSSISFHAISPGLGGFPFRVANKSWEGALIAPALRAVTFEDTANPFKYPIIFENLTSLRIINATEISGELLMKTIIAISPTLQELVFSLSPSQPTPFNDSMSDASPRISLPELTRLDICLHQEYDTKWLLDALITPSLAFIALGRVSPDTWAKAVTSLIDRSSATPREAKIKDIDKVYRYGRDIYHPAARNVIGTSTTILSNLPSVTTIRIESDKMLFTNDMVNAITGSFAALNQPSKVVYRRPQFRDEELQALFFERRLEVTPRMPAVVIARVEVPDVDLEKIDGSEDLKGVTTLFEIEGLRRIDMYF